MKEPVKPPDPPVQPPVQPPVPSSPPLPPALLRLFIPRISVINESLSVAKGGSYSVVLRDKPDTDVTITFAADPALKFTPEKLHFTMDNWNVSQVVSVEITGNALVNTQIRHHIAVGNSKWGYTQRYWCVWDVPSANLK